jgi:hypothetical protein
MVCHARYVADVVKHMSLKRLRHPAIKHYLQYTKVLWCQPVGCGGGVLPGVTPLSHTRLAMLLLDCCRERALL